MLNERKSNTLEFAVTECSSSETSGGETSSTRTLRNVSLVENVKTLKVVKSLRINNRASPIPFGSKSRPQSHQILKSKSGQSIKDFERQET
jgi:hypothetical protein